MSETLYHVSANPHVRDNGSTQKIMLDVIIALLPATIFGIYIFGASAALTVAISVATCVVVEYIYQKLMKQPITVSDLSAALTGLLLALNLRPGAILDADLRWNLRNHRCKTGIRWTRTELHEPSPWCKMFLNDLICSKNDKLYI